ncbi:unnamed protein product [Mycena citricolor]|uniref:Major facilitator superfamily (MFS) profile domain-containing protein n=1 Tax=Mycena citricolor TaxID=2018698 RepID=A0AAD2Q2N5_9AGAR|nr:unnamed protein product [Mycena citricolor]
MAGGGTSSQPLSSARRKNLAGKSGWAGLVENRRVFVMAVFASLGGLLYGYNQGVFSGVLGMRNFDDAMGNSVTDSGKKGWLVSILELGAWLGVLLTGYIADKISRKYAVVVAVIVFCIGVIVQTTAHASPSIYGGRFVTGLGVGSLSMVVPLYNSEISPPEVRGSLVALQQLAITFGIMISFWIDYGTNYIGGTGATQSEAAWRIPLALQLVPALFLGIGILWMPFSPRWLVNQGRNDEALAVLSRVRGQSSDSEVVQIEYLEIQAQYLFEKETLENKFPQYQDGSFSSDFKLGFFAYFTMDRQVYFRFYLESIFQKLGLTGNTISLLATGVVGILMFLATIPAVLWIDKLGRRPILISGAFVMAICHFIVAILTGLYQNSWPDHVAAGWVACVFVWIFAIGFGYSWGPSAWVIVAEIWPLSVRGKGLSIAASSNWMNNFIVGQVTPTMLQHIGFGTFVFFGAFSLMGGLFVLFFVPETKGRTLEEMEEVFSDSAKIALEDQARLDAIYKRLGLHDASTTEKNDIEDKAAEDRISNSVE